MRCHVMFRGYIFWQHWIVFLLQGPFFRKVLVQRMARARYIKMNVPFFLCVPYLLWSWGALFFNVQEVHWYVLFCPSLQDFIHLFITNGFLIMCRQWHCGCGQISARAQPVHRATRWWALSRLFFICWLSHLFNLLMNLGVVIQLAQNELITLWARLRNISIISRLVPTNLHCWYDCYEIDILQYCSEFPEYPSPYKVKNVPTNLIAFFFFGTCVSQTYIDLYDYFLWENSFRLCRFMGFLVPVTRVCIYLSFSSDKLPVPIN